MVGKNKSTKKTPEIIIEDSEGNEVVSSKESKKKKEESKKEKKTPKTKGKVGRPRKKEKEKEKEKKESKKKKEVKRESKSEKNVKKKASRKGDSPQKKKGKSKKEIKHEERCAEIEKKIDVPIDKNIQALLDSERTFVDNITRKAKRSMLSFFHPFPKGVSFSNTEKDEVVVLVVRHHWTGLISAMVLAVFVLFLPFILSFVTDTWFERVFSLVAFNTGMFIFFIMLSITIVLDAFYKLFFEMNVLTTSRIIDLDFVSIMTHRLSETTYDQVQDVSYSPAGPLASLFNYGDLYIQTAASKNEFHFDKITRPTDVQDTIWDLRFLRMRKIGQMDK